MGYTHYWTQVRDFSRDEWSAIVADVSEILKEAQHNQGIALANCLGDGGTSPEISDSIIGFNGVGEDSHETLVLHRIREELTEQDIKWGRKRGRDFCKTARKPYDPVVTAVLCYMSTITRQDDKAGEPIIGSEALSVSSDGDGGDFLAGLELARKALPAKANLLDIPMGIMQDDRWCAPWVQNRLKTHAIRFCVDGKAYIIREKDGASYCFPTHLEAAQWLEQTKETKREPDIWNAYGSFDSRRHDRLEKAQRRKLAEMVKLADTFERDQKPPAYVRPGEMPNNAGRQFCYNVADLLKLCA